MKTWHSWPVLLHAHLPTFSSNLKSEEDESPIKRCPKCKVYIERDEGCAQMMCKNCKHAFCWYCLESLDVRCSYSMTRLTSFLLLLLLLFKKMSILIIYPKSITFIGMSYYMSYSLSTVMLGYTNMLWEFLSAASPRLLRMTFYWSTMIKDPAGINWVIPEPPSSGIGHRYVPHEHIPLD